MQNSITATISKKVLTELGEDSAAELRDYLTHLFTHYAASKEWSEATDNWKGEAITAHRVLCRALDALQAWQMQGKAPENVLRQLGEAGAAELREYLTHLFTHYAASKEWSEATDNWKADCTIFHRVLCRSLDSFQIIEFEEIPALELTA
ncbi:MAG: hypothetical protein IPN76_16720 [Saprospiraceae bacterium]|nr:hypothetical protein [Saprospiraceae bacterium]